MHFADPDMYVRFVFICTYLWIHVISFFQWQDILQVIIPRSSALASAAASGTLCTQEEGYTTCPICLSPPTAPRMTKCGHVSVHDVKAISKILIVNKGFLFSMYSSLSEYIRQ